MDLHQPSGDDIRPEGFRLDVRTRSLGVLTVRFGGDGQVPGTPEQFRNRVLGGSDVDGDGCTEIFVQIGQGASTSFVGIFRVWQHHLERVTIDGRPTDLGLGGSVGVLDWFDCERHQLTVWEDKATPNWKAYTETTDRYSLVGTELMLRTNQSRRVHGPSSPAANGCPGLSG